MVSKNLFSFIFTFFVALAFPVSSYAINYYVSTTGSDSNGTGTIDKPFATMSKASTVVGAGSTVYLRGGTYFTTTNLTSGSGTSSAYVTYQPYPGEKVIINGSKSSVTEHQSLITLYKVNYVKINGFELAYSSGRGISATDSNFITISNNLIHDTKYKAIGASGSNITIDRNEVYNAVMVNAGGVNTSGGWPQAVSTWKKGDGSASQNIYITNNHIYNSWGEGIDAIALDGGRITGNRVSDTFSVLIYTDNARNIVIDGNYLTAANPQYYRSGYPAVGIMISAEDCCIPNPSYESENITISNNLVDHTKSALRYWNGDFNNPYRNLKVFNNTFVGSVNDPAIYFYSVNTSGNEMRNNIIRGGGTMPNSASWSFSNNNWVGGKPTFDTSPTSFSSTPQFVSPVIGGPADGYKLKSGDSSIGKGISTVVTKDFFGTVRPAQPTLGFYEYDNSGTSPNPEPTPKPWTTMEGDYTTWSTNYLKTMSGFISGDFSENGVVDGVDFVLWLTKYGY